MFREWGSLISEMVVLILLVALLGFFVGWLIWGRWSSMNVDTGEADHLRRELDACKAKHFEKDARIAALGAEASASVSAAHEAGVTSEGVLDYDGDGILQGENEGSKPQRLTARAMTWRMISSRSKVSGRRWKRYATRLAFITSIRSPLGRRMKRHGLTLISKASKVV